MYPFHAITYINHFTGKAQFSSNWHYYLFREVLKNIFFYLKILLSKIIIYNYRKETHFDVSVRLRDKDTLISFFLQFGYKFNEISYIYLEFFFTGELKINHAFEIVTARPGIVLQKDL